METKKCSKCGKEYPATKEYYHSNKRGKYGLVSVCKKCHKDWYKNYYNENHEKELARGRKYRRSHKKEIAEHSREYRDNNRQRLNYERRMYYLRNKEKISLRLKKYNKLHGDEMRNKWREQYAKNKDKRRARRALPENKAKLRAYRQQHSEEIRICNKKYVQTHREKVNESAQVWHKLHPEWRRAYITNRLHNDPVFRMINSFRKGLWKAIKLNKTTKSKKSEELLGCTWEELRHYIELKFLPGMTWKNYGYYGWHVDHKKPVAAFDLTKPEEQLKCFNYKNLQPMWWGDNLSKTSKYEGVLFKTKQWVKA